MPIVFTWADWLQNNTLEHLAINGHLVISPGLGPESGSDVSAGSESAPISSHVGVETDDAETIVEALIIYNHRKQEEEFLTNPQDL